MPLKNLTNLKEQISRGDVNIEILTLSQAFEKNS